MSEKSKSFLKSVESEPKQSLRDRIWERDPLNRKTELQAVGYGQLDRKVLGDKFPTKVVDANGTETEVSDFTEAGKTAYIQGYAARALAKLLNFDEATANKLVCAALFYKVDPAAEKEANYTGGDNGFYEYRATVPNRIAEYVQDKKIRDLSVDDDFRQLVVCSGHTSNNIVEQAHSTQFSEPQNTALLALSWLNQRLDKTGLVPGVRRLAALQETWKDRVPLPAIQQCMELSMQSGEQLAKIANANNEEQLVNEINRLMLNDLNASAIEN
jgi:hypothetical protein